jgi:hypothetical protein
MRRPSVFLAVLAWVAGSLAGIPARSAPHAPHVSEVRVERVKPARPKHTTLAFLKDNRDFIRGQLDRLRQHARDGHDAAQEIDPRYLAYQDMLAAIAAGADSVTAAEAERQRHTLMASVTRLGDLEAQLDQMERQLTAQRARLGVLQTDFTGDQRTALVIVVAGYPQSTTVTEIAISLEDGARWLVPLTSEHQSALRDGGVVQVFHEFVEPRQQVVEIAATVAGRPGPERGFITLEPARNGVTFLRMNLSRLSEPAGMTADTWLHDSRLPDSDG